MTRTEYIAKLTKYLRKLPQKDYEEALEYFMEYFEEAGPENEAQVIAELGTPKEAAHEVISRDVYKRQVIPQIAVIPADEARAFLLVSLVFKAIARAAPP